MRDTLIMSSRRTVWRPLKEIMMGDQREHRDHQPGTISECRQCAALAYEPGWYASLITWSQTVGVPTATRTVTT